MNLVTTLIVEMLGEFAASGFTMRETATETGMAYAAVAKYARAHDLKFLRGGLSTPSERSAEMAALYVSGKTLEHIGGLYGVSRERVRQIITKHHGLTARSGGASKAAKDKRKKFYADRDARCMKQWGCPWSQYVLLRDMGKPTRAFTFQRHSAADRGIGWELTLWQWWTIWQESGHWEDRGRGRAYQMCRKNDQGPYSIDNVYIATGVENMKDYWVAVRGGVKPRILKSGAHCFTPEQKAEAKERSKDIVRAAVARYRQTPKFKLRYQLRRQGLPKEQRDAIVASQFGASS